MNRTLKTLFLLPCSATAFSITLISCDLVERKKEQFKTISYERKVARFEKAAEEFKTTLGPRDRIITERIDSVAQKVFYTIEKDPEFDIDKDIMVHDYETGETKSVLPASHKIEDYEFSLIGVEAAKMIEDRLFLIISSGCMGVEGITGVFYVNIRDNSLHYVESCNDAEFEGFNSLHIKKMYRLGMQDEWTAKFETMYYSLSTLLSDEAYATNRWEQKRKEERLAEEWRKHEEKKRLEEERRRQGIERIIKFDYSLILNMAGLEDYVGSLSGASLYRDGVYTKAVGVPKGKVWQLKSISYSGYPESKPPRFYYSMNENGAFGFGLKELENGQILYPNGYGYVSG